MTHDLEQHLTDAAAAVAAAGALQEGTAAKPKANANAKAEAGAKPRSWVLQRYVERPLLVVAGAGAAGARAARRPRRWPRRRRARPRARAWAGPAGVPTACGRCAARRSTRVVG